MATAAEHAEVARQITVLADRRATIPGLIAELQAEYTEVARQLVALSEQAQELTGALGSLLTDAATDLEAAGG